MLLPASGYFLLKNPNVQDYAAHKLMQIFSRELDTKFKVESVNYTMFNKIILNNVYIEDQQGDSLLTSEKVTGHLKLLDLRNRRLFFKKLHLNHAKIHMHNDTSRAINIQFLVQALKRKDTTKARMHTRFNEIQINNSEFIYTTNKKAKPGYGVDFNRINLHNFNIHLENLDVDQGKLNLDLSTISFTDKSGFKLLNMKTKAFLYPEKGGFRDMIIRTPNSYINADSIVFNHNGYENFDQFIDEVPIRVAIKRSNLAFSDLAYFAKPFHGVYNHNFVFSGALSGTVNNLKGREIYAAMGRQTEIKTDFNADGLPNIGETFLYVDIDRLYTGLPDLDIINSLLPNAKKIHVPANLSKLGLVKYSGNFTGFFDDFVAYGTLETDMGELSTDISIKPQHKRSLKINGKLKTNNFDIGGLLNSEKHIGQLSMDVQVNGTAIRNQGFKADTDGKIKKLEVNGYHYKNIKLNGLLTDKKYAGALNIKDPNINLSFSGGIDFSGEIPVFDFQADIKNARLHALNFVKDDTTARFSAELMSNFKGNSLDNINGDIKLTKGNLVKNDQHLDLDNFSIHAQHDSDTHKILLNSDYIEGALIGKYRSTSVYQSMKNLFYSYLPVMTEDQKDTSRVIKKNNFNLSINLKNVDPITQIFAPKLDLARHSKVNLQYNGKKNTFSLKAQTDTLQYGHYFFDDFQINSSSRDTIFALVTTFEKLHLAKNDETHYLHNFELKSLTGNNSSRLLAEWQEPYSIQSKGKMLALVDFKRSPESQNIQSDISILPGEVRLKNEVWKIAESSITIDSSSIVFNRIQFHHNDQEMTLDGKITQNPEDYLFVEFRDIQLDYADILFPRGKINFNGLINGQAKAKDIYGQPVFQSNIQIDTFQVNGVAIGNTQVVSRWDSEKEDIWIDLQSQRGNLNSLDFEGTYTPDNQLLDFDIQMDKLSLEILNPILQNSFSDIQGALSGQLTMQGKTYHPKLNGNLVLQKAALTIDYLKTRYYITHQVDVSNNRLIFNQAKVYDEQGNQAILDGNIFFKRLKNLSYELNIDAEKFRTLKTTSNDNSIYYGAGYVTGLVKVQGNTSNLLDIDASVATDRNTIINLPINSSSEQKRSKFITFKSNSERSTAKTPEEKYNVDLSGIDMNFDLEVTPQAETRLIFNPELGDMIKASGRGNLNMEVNQNGDFRIFGEYIIEDGDYMFSLKNVINKKFEIQQGSRILWNGNPQDADINVTAVYNLRTSLDNLFMDTTSYYQKRIPVECKINLRDKLNNPSINFEIDLPTADETTKARLNSALSSKEEMNKQFLSLLVLNTFMPAQQYMAGQPETSELGATGMAFTTSELLSNQLSHWLSQISNNWDIGVNYQPGDEISRDQVEVALSTQLLNDRLIINGNVGSGGRYAQASEIVGDFRVDWKLTQNGKLRLKFFNRNSDRLIYEETRYIQGAGLYYREEFNTFGEILKNIMSKFRTKNKRKSTNN